MNRANNQAMGQQWQGNEIGSVRGASSNCIGTANNVCGISKEVPRKMEQLTACISNLEMAVGALTERLQPVLNSGPPSEICSGPSGGTPSIEQTKIGSELEELRARVQHMTGRLDSHLERLEI